jgi:DNA repair exonuclease SbcCD ATPase subunit
MELHFDRYYQKVTEDVSKEMPSDGSRVSSFTMDTSLALSVETYGERRPIAVLSRGERDLVSFCARLALLESIFTKEPPVLLLDDPFINLDDENYAKAARLLSHLAERFQIIYTVCSTVRLPEDLPLKTL